MSGEERGYLSLGHRYLPNGGGEWVPELGIVLRFWPGGWVR